jgi:hypothetical protein
MAVIRAVAGGAAGLSQVPGGVCGYRLLDRLPTTSTLWAFSGALSASFVAYGATGVAVVTTWTATLESPGGIGSEGGLVRLPSTAVSARRGFSVTSANARVELAGRRRSGTCRGRCPSARPGRADRA